MFDKNSVKILRYCLEWNLSFAIYRLPHSTCSCILISKNVEQINLKSLSGVSPLNGFIITPFDIESYPTLYLASDIVIKDDADPNILEIIKEWPVKPVSKIKEESETKYVSYEKQFSQIYLALSDGKIRKAILSRVKHHNGVDKFQALDIFSDLEEKYKNAYIFMYSTPQSGLWLGASPELILEVDKEKATTVSLAGTRKHKGGIDWTNKEQEEQKIVSEFILRKLNEFNINPVEVSGPETISAGKVCHLRTSYSFQASQLHGNFGKLLKALHPTPALCGVPKDAAMELIKNTEDHDRTYYGGFLGPIDMYGNTNLFVNIRSLRFSDNKALLYLGGGITVGSNVKAEWDETELKAQTLLSILKNIRTL